MINLDLPRKVGYSKRKKSGDQYIKVDKACRIGRTYEDFLEFIMSNDSCSILLLKLTVFSQFLCLSVQ